MYDDLEIPAFLRIPQEERRAAWRDCKVARCTRRQRTRDFWRPRGADEDPAYEPMRRAAEKEKEARRAARLAALRERR